MRERRGPLGVVPSGGESAPLGPVHIETGIWRLPSGRFTAYVYHRGQDVYVGCFGTFAEASDARTARLTELRGGRPVVGRRRVAKLGVAEFLRSVYLPFANGQVRPSTARANTSRCRKWVEPFWAKIVFADVTYDTCVRFRTHLAEGGSSGQTQREAFCLLRSALAEGVRRGYLAANPATEIELPKRRATRVHVPKPAVADAVVAAITAPVPHMLASFLRLTASASTRPSPLRGMTSISMRRRHISRRRSTRSPARSAGRRQTAGTARSTCTPTSWPSSARTARARRTERFPGAIRGSSRPRTAGRGP